MQCLDDDGGDGGGVVRNESEYSDNNCLCNPIMHHISEKREKSVNA
jgi:hypothetical protein